MVAVDGHEQDAPASGIALVEEQTLSVVRMWGDIDLEVRRVAGGVCQTVAARALPLAIDARDVTFMDSTGMSILVRLARDAEAGGYPIVLHQAPWVLRELLSITGVDRLLPMSDAAPET